MDEHQHFNDCCFFLQMSYSKNDEKKTLKLFASRSVLGVETSREPPTTSWHNYVIVDANDIKNKVKVTFLSHCKSNEHTPQPGQSSQAVYCAVFRRRSCRQVSRSPLGASTQRRLVNEIFPIHNEIILVFFNRKLMANSTIH